MLPLYLTSGAFVAVSTLPAWLVHVADVFPVRPLAAALLTAYDPHTHGAGLAGTDLIIVAAWGTARLWSPSAGSAGSPSATDLTQHPSLTDPRRTRP